MTKRVIIVAYAKMDLREKIATQVRNQRLLKNRIKKKYHPPKYSVYSKKFYHAILMKCYARTAARVSTITRATTLVPVTMAIWEKVVKYVSMNDK